MHLAGGRVRCARAVPDAAGGVAVAGGDLFASHGEAGEELVEAEEVSEQGPGLVRLDRFEVG